MYRKILLLMATPFFLTGCFFQKEENTQGFEKKNEEELVVERSYDEIAEYRIFWSDIFKQCNELYYVYLYSLTCSHCRSIKNEMIDYGVKQTLPIYFVESSPEHSIGEKFDKNSPVFSIESLLIRGYPTLLRLEENVVVYIAEGTKEIFTELKI